MKLTHLLSTLLLSAVALTACGGGDTAGGSGDGGPPALVVDAEGVSSFDSTALGVNLAMLPISTLTEAEKESLIFMREEERLALDVYQRMDAVYGGTPKVFGNIAKSEATHTEAVRQLLVRYNLTDTTANLAPGLYQNARIQALYNQLVQAGSVSLVEALKVGAAIEEIDMIDLNAAMVNVVSPDIRLVFENLLKGSRNHLRSFVKNLSQQGVTYVPQYMDRTAYDAIIGTPTER